MPQYTHNGLREGTGRQPEPTGREKLIESARTEPEAFLRWGAQHEREEGKYEPSRGRVTCDMISAPMPHARLAKNIVLGLGRLLDSNRFDIRIADLAVQTPAGIHRPDVEEYAATETPQTCPICSQDEPRAWVWRRQDDESWPRLPTEMAGRDGSVALGGPDMDLSIAAIFRGIPDAPTVE
jgi:hypothetical protein